MINTNSSEIIHVIRVQLDYRLGDNMQSEQFLGLTKRQSYDLAEKLGLMVRIIRMGEKPLLPYPNDVRDDRICLELDERRVSKAVVQ